MIDFTTTAESILMQDYRVWLCVWSERNRVSKEKSSISRFIVTKYGRYQSLLRIMIKFAWSTDEKFLLFARQIIIIGIKVRIKKENKCSEV